MTPHCWQCGYELTGLTTPRCPECGRPFDPADPSTMNLGKPMGRLARWMLRGVSRPIAALFLLAALLILSTTRWPVKGTTFSFLDLRHYARVWEWKARLKSLTPWDTLYMAGLTFLSLALFAWFTRTLLRTLAVWRYRPPTFQRRPQRLLHLLSLSSMLLATAAIGYGWPFRLAQRWAADEWTTWQSLQPANLAATGTLSFSTATANLNLIPTTNASTSFPANTLNFSSANTYTGPTIITSGTLTLTGINVVTPPSPPTCTEPQKSIIVRSMIRQGPSARDRLCGLRLLHIAGPRPDPRELIDALPYQRDPQIRAALIHLLAVYRDFAHLDVLVPLLDDKNQLVRAAAIDAIAYIREPAFTQDTGILLGGAHLNTTPPIPFNTIAGGGNVVIPRELRQRFEQSMLHAPTLEEREAAARALLTWPPQGYSLRLAEWGVWSANAAGDLSPVPAQLDSIPPFVHPTGNPAAEFSPRVTWPMNVWKPVIHLTANMPLAVDLEVVLNQGRPLYAYPRPDDFAILPGNFARSSSGGIELLDDTTKPILPDLREGYPWLTPPHRMHQLSYLSSGVPNPIAGMGLRWQSLIVSPEKQPWMKEPPLPADDKFKWWQHCRNTNASWISSRGESEKFLYYDGPTKATTGFRFAFEENKLRFSVDNSALLPPKDPPGAPTSRSLMFVRVDGGGANAWSISDFRWKTPDLAQPPTPALQTFQSLLLQKGLREDEANALIQTWKKEFFQTPGQRVLLILSQADYNTLIPLTLRPTPTTTTRVGIIWYELK